MIQINESRNTLILRNKTVFFESNEKLRGGENIEL